MIDLLKFLTSKGDRRPARRGSRRLRPGLDRLEGRCVPALLLVGPTQAYTLPSQAAAVAHDGDTVQIDAGTYRNDVATWTANDLTITGAGGVAKLDVTGYTIANRKGIWVVAGDNTTIRDVEFTGAHDAGRRDKNWAGIRQEGTTLTVDHCSFHHNDEGILTGANAASDVTIRNSDFGFNGYGDGQSHNMYIGQVRSFTLEFSSSHDARVGHLVKSRAQANVIRYNRLIGGATGTDSYELDLPNGGDSVVVGNVIQQGPKTQNSTILSYAAEGATNAVQRLYAANNTFVNDRPSGGLFVYVKGASADVRLINNIFAGPGTVLSGVGTRTTNFATSSFSCFEDPAAYNYSLVSTALAAIDAGTDPGIDLTPLYQYDYATATWVARPVDESLDIGSDEYVA